MMNSLDVISFWASGRWREKKKFVEWVNATGIQLNGISEFYSHCTLNIDKSSGDQLDLIGAILKTPRLSIPENFIYFGYQGTAGATGYNVAPYFAPNELNLTPIPDAYYQIALKARILYNTTDGSRDSIIRAAQLLLSTKNIELVDNEDMTFYIIIHDDIDDNIIYFINYYGYYIKPAGVKFLDYRNKLGITYTNKLAMTLSSR